MKKLRQFKQNFWLSLVFTLVLFIESTFFFILNKKNPNNFFSFAEFIFLVLYFLFATSIQSNLVRKIAILLPLVVAVPELIFFHYSKLFMLPIEFVDFYDAIDDLWLVYSHSTESYALWVTLPSILCFLYLDKKVTNRSSFKYSSWAFSLFIVLGPFYANLAKFPLGNPPPVGTSVYTIGYTNIVTFLGRIAPTLIFKYENTSKNESTEHNAELLIKNQQESEWENILLIVGESLTSRHMSLFDYARNTTPFLTSLNQNSSQFKRSTSLAVGTSTYSSLSLFFNLGHGQDGLKRIHNKRSCLFSFAKIAKFRTHFISLQNDGKSYIRNYCPEYIDNIILKKKISVDQKPLQFDIESLNFLFSTISKHAGKNLFVLQMMGSHAPWKIRFQDESRKFLKPESIDYYDNSVVEFDSFISEVVSQLNKIKSKTLLVFISDHGESLGFMGHWGHGFFNKSVFETPFILYSNKLQLPEKIKNIDPLLTHYNVALIVLDAMGITVSDDPFKFPKNLKL